MYSPSEIANLLDIPPSTLRRWAKQFAPLLSESAKGEGRKRTYSEDDLDLLARIRVLASKNVPLDQIPERLGEVIDHPIEKQDQVTALALPGVIKEFQRISTLLTELQASQQEQQETIDQLQTQLDELRQELKFSRLPWYRRLFRRPPD